MTAPPGPLSSRAAGCGRARCRDRRQSGLALPGMGLTTLLQLLLLLLLVAWADGSTSTMASTAPPPAGWMEDCRAVLQKTAVPVVDETLLLCDQLWDRASAHYRQQKPPPQQHKHKPFFGPWHFGRGKEEQGEVGPLGTSGKYATFKDPDDVLNLCVALACVLCAAMAAGLTIGLMSVDPLELEIKQRVGTAEECRQASVVLPLIQRHHLLLVTLLLYNSAANETLPLFLDRLVPSYVAVLLSVTMVLLFGEILPSALFSGPNQLRIAARLANFVWLLMFLLSPISYPLAWLLDRWFGQHSPRKRYNRAELSALIEIHREVKRRNISIVASSSSTAAAITQQHQRTASGSGSTGATATRAGLLSRSQGDGGESGQLTIQQKPQGLLPAQQQGGQQGPIATPGGNRGGAMLSQDEVDIVVGVLKIASKTAQDCMVPWSGVFCLSTADALDERLLATIMASGFSRIPVFEGADPSFVRGFLLTKRLIVIDPAAHRPVASLALRRPLMVAPDCPLIDLLNAFQEGRSHLALVAKEPHAALDCMTRGLPLRGGAAPLGIVTLEDLIEEIIQEEILDEHDRSRELLEQRQRRRNKRFGGPLGTHAATQVVSASLLRKQQQQQQQMQQQGQGQLLEGQREENEDEDEEQEEEEEEAEGLLQATGVGMDVDAAVETITTTSNRSSGSTVRSLPPLTGGGVIDVRQQVVLDLAIHALKTTTTTTTSSSSPFASAPTTLSHDLEEGPSPLLLPLSLSPSAASAEAAGPVALPPQPPASPHLRLRGLGQARNAAAAPAGGGDQVDDGGGWADDGVEEGVGATNSKSTGIPERWWQRRGGGLEEPLLRPSSPPPPSEKS